MTELAKIKSQIKKSKKVALFGHISPDGDCFGSLFAFYYYLKNENKKVDIFIDDEIPSYYFNVFPINIIKKNLEENDYDTLISVDCGDANRMGKFSTLFTDQANTILIDHHITGDKSFAKYKIIKPFSSSTCEIIYELFKYLKVNITPKIATCIYAGISTDTGSFMYSNVSSDTLIIASELLDLGADTRTINDYLFRYMSKSQIEMQKFLYNKIEIYEDKLAIASVSFKELRALNAEKGDTKEFYNIMLSIEGIKVAILLNEHEPKNIKCSIRTKDNYSAINIATKFNGGGHRQASGCLIGGLTMENAKKKVIKEALEEVHNASNNSVK